ncbi:MAG TPA: HAD family hydrolase [Candidatus Rifleibacterium sp.]|nr:HAD family hydrolase [Candidatus Rifleibacterium sp.]HPT48524.1 HAD family hydrolase [Candidatus Rifleibacterium sp.]
MKLALFDFDGTITTHDSYRDFLLFVAGKLRFAMLIMRLSPWLIAWLTGLADNQSVKQKTTAMFIGGMRRERFDELARAFVKQKLGAIVRPAALEKIRWHKNQGHRVIVVSASFTDYLKFWCAEHELEVLSTRLEEIDGCLTGRFATPNCFGPEKVRRIRELLCLEDYETIYAYGDSRGDREMLEIAHEKGYRVF